jgi:hypothetical protein
LRCTACKGAACLIGGDTRYSNGDDDADTSGTGAGIDAEGVGLVGPNGLLQRVTKLVVENRLEGRLVGHLGDEAGPRQA